MADVVLSLGLAVRFLAEGVVLTEMTSDEIERNIAFIIEHQARFDSDIERINEAIASINETLAKHNDAIAGLNDAIAGLIRVSHGLLDHQKAMETRQAAAENQMSEIRTEMKELARAQKSTDQRLNVLIDVVEKHISSHEQGRHSPA
jgi:chromosome segregation ATPase